MTRKLPNLQILEINSLAVLEWHDEQRTPPLIERLRSSGLLRNPPIVSPLQDGSGRYMVLDGTNRTSALRKMGLPHVIAQVAESDSPNLELKTWNHVLWGQKPDELINELKKIKDLKLQTSVENLASQWENQALTWIQTADGEAHTVKIQSHNLVSRVKMLNKIVDSYKDRAKMDRTRAKNLEELRGLYKDLCAVVVFPPFEIADVIELCSQGNLMPAGITRFTI